MNPVRILPIALLIAASAMVAVPASADDLTVDFKFGKSDRCSAVSPEIHVSGAPAGTASFRVRLRDLDVPSWRHGGGTVPADASGVIAPGALKEGYNGPCPPQGSHHYEFTVKAQDANDDTLAEGSASQVFP